MKQNVICHPIGCKQGTRKSTARCNEIGPIFTCQITRSSPPRAGFGGHTRRESQDGAQGPLIGAGEARGSAVWAPERQPTLLQGTTRLFFAARRQRTGRLYSLIDTSAPKSIAPRAPHAARRRPAGLLYYRFCPVLLNPPSAPPPSPTRHVW